LVVFSFLIACKNEKQPELITQESKDPKINKLKLPPGFLAERLYTPSENDQGSWVSMAFDHKGRMIVSDQYGTLYRFSIPAAGDSSSIRPEQLQIPIDSMTAKDTSANKVGIGFAHGLLYAFNSLYVVVNNHMRDEFKRPSGLYRLQDTDGDDQYDKISLLKEMDGHGEHGPHSIILSPDKKSLYLVAGNFTKVPSMDAYKVEDSTRDDNLLPLIKDPNGHDNPTDARGGWIAHLDSTGTHWELISSGFRNSFDIAFNDAGDLFTYDSDMEWDIGLPWYRPTRIYHVPSGGEFGWRRGTNKWPETFADNVPPVINIGQGSPTNFISGAQSTFPGKYRQSLFAFDWSFGIIYAVQMIPEGSTYRAEAEEFISGSALPLTDGTFGPDGALYFLTGGRRLESDLYRIRYTGKENEKEEKQASVVINEENKLRRKLEEYHQPQSGAVGFAWPQLKHPDRLIRFAARVAIEHQPVQEWQDLTLKEKDPVILSHAAMALARKGNNNSRDQLVQALNNIDYKNLTESQQLDLLRAYELVFLRMGDPGDPVKQEVIAKLDASYPAKNNELNRQLSKLLIHLQAASAVGKTLALLQTAKDDSSAQKTFTNSSDLILRNPQYGLDIARMLSKTPPLQQTYYATMLSLAKTGWTPELHEQYFRWFSNSYNYEGGHSFTGFIEHAKELALKNVPRDRVAHFTMISKDTSANKTGLTAGRIQQPKGPGRQWKIEEAVTAVGDEPGKRNFSQGKSMFVASACGSCHRIGGEGEEIGPDLTQLGTRFSIRDMLESIIEPNKTISDQYASTVFHLKNGTSVVGRMIREDANKYHVSQNPFAPQSLREIDKKDVSKTGISTTSIMMPGMINRLNEEELKDLLSYLMSGGNKDHEIYKGKKQ